MQGKNSTVFYHEDFYRQIELIPEENYFAVGRYIDEQTPIESSKYGIYNMTIRPERKVKLLDRKISFLEIKEILQPISLMYSEDVTTGYGRDVHKAKNTVVWGFEQYGIFVKYEHALVEAIWLSHSPVFSQTKTGRHLAEAIFNTSKRYSLILIDWDENIICRAQSEKDIKEYLFQNMSFDQF